jgi:hypothetical protein
MNNSKFDGGLLTDKEKELDSIKDYSISPSTVQH